MVVFVFKKISWENKTVMHNFYGCEYFLAHLIDFYQMCYCCRKLEKLHFQWISVRLWEAVWGRAPLIGSLICLSQSGEHGLTRPHRSASQIWESKIRPHTHTASQLLSCDLSEPIRGARPHTASHGLTEIRTPRSVRPWEADLWGRSPKSEVPIGLYRAKQCV